MTVKVLIKRRFKEKYFNEISAMLKELRYGALGQVGYISAETLWDAKDPFRVVVAATSSPQNATSRSRWKIGESTQTSFRCPASAHGSLVM